MAFLSCVGLIERARLITWLLKTNRITHNRRLMVSGNVYKIKFGKGDTACTIRLWKTPHKQEATARIDAKEAVFKFTKGGAEFIQGDRFPEDIENRIRRAIMQYCYNWRIHK